MRDCAGYKKISCGECGVEWQVTEGWQKARKRDHKTFYCPNGHSRWYPGETKQEKEIRELKVEVARLKHSYTAVCESRTHWRERAEHEERRRTGYQGALAKAKLELIA